LAQLVKVNTIVKHNRIGAKVISFIQDQQHNIELKLEQQLGNRYP
jgi:hypothetical protein